MTALFGVEYFGFIASAYAIVFLALVGLTLWIVQTHRHRKKVLKALEEAGIKRASKHHE